MRFDRHFLRACLSQHRFIFANMENVQDQHPAARLQNPPQLPHRFIPILAIAQVVDRQRQKTATS